MREILFRGKRTDDYEWIEGSLCTTIPSDEDFYTISYFDFEGYYIEEKVIPETVGQYTGLTDKNDKKIFEGDIIQSLETKETAVVQWFPEHSAFMVWCKSSNEVGFLYECRKSNIEVIGNIHDNSELMKVGDGK